MTANLNRREVIGSALAVVAYTAIGSAAAGKIRIGQIGVGHAHASGKMQTMRKLTELYEVVGIAEPDERLRAAGQKNPAYAGLNWLSVEQLLDTPGLQAVAVETEVKNLVPTAQRCVERGLHIHLDKPGGESLPAFRRMIETAVVKRATVQMGYMLRYNPGMQVCYRAVREGWLGEVFGLHAEMSKRSDGERGKLAPYAGGMMFELGCHLLDSIVYMFGKPERVTPFNRASGLNGDTLKDNSAAVLEWGKTVGTVKASLIDFAGGPRRQLVLSGTEGTTELRPLEPPKLELTLSRPRGGHKKGRQEVALERREGRYDGEFVDLASVIRGEKTLAWTAAHDVGVQETLLRASGLPTD